MANAVQSQIGVTVTPGQVAEAIRETLREVQQARWEHDWGINTLEYAERYLIERVLKRLGLKEGAK